MSGTLYIVATPIGNLEDITLRALRILGEANVIFAEDTRVAKKLLAKYEIDTPVHRLDAHTEAKGAAEIIERIKEGQKVAYVSDAGTPGVSDPGARLVARAREAGARVETIPGPSSVTAALAIAGVSGDSFTFLGFLPHKKGRQTALRGIAETERLVVLFESTHRIGKLLNELHEYIPGRTVTIARELTKVHEEVLTGAPNELLGVLTEYPEKQKGEFVVLVHQR